MTVAEPLAVAHAVPGRLRLRGRALRDPALDPAATEARLEGLPGVRRARLNRQGATLVVEYEGGAEVAQRLPAQCGALLAGPSDELPPLAEAGGIDGSGLLASVAALAAFPLLPGRAKRLAGWLALAPTLGKGAATLLTEGVKVEVLDAVAVALSARQGNHYTALITQALLELGQVLEQTTARQSDRLLRHLLRPPPGEVWVERDGGEAVRLPADQVRAGDRVVVGPGETIPVDGRVADGAAAVNESSITGEPLARRKEAGAAVIAGTVVEEGRLKVLATRVGADATTARIGRFLEESLRKRSETQRMAEELADRRVYYTIGMGALVWLLTRDAGRAASVFLVDYACALKLGTPVAIKSAMYRAARHGILLRGGHAVEGLAAADTVIFDKTGTLTHGELEVTEVESLAEEAWPEQRLLALVASVEEHASHPVAAAVVASAQARGLRHVSHEEVDYLVAHGVTSQVREGRLAIGSRHFLEAHEGVSFAVHEGRIEALEGQGRTLLLVALGGRPLGIVALRDRLRDDAAAVVARLRGLGVRRLVMLTGDRRPKAEALAALLGLDEVVAECSPEEKARTVARLREAGARVLFVGDGVNDAPALAGADVGVAMPKGADLARATADVVLLEDRLAAVAEAKELAARTMALIRANFSVSTAINSGVMVGAALGLVGPTAAALLHNGTTLGVLLNALGGVSGPVAAQHRPPAAAQEKLRTIGAAFRVE